MASFRDTRTRILLFFLLGIALPSGLLGYLAFRGIQNDRALVERQQRNELEQLAGQVQATLASRLGELTATVSRAVARSHPTPTDLRAALRDHPLLEAIFTLDPSADSSVRIVAARGLRLVSSGGADWPIPAGSPEAWKSDFTAASARELRTGDLAGSLAGYRRALAQAPDQQSRGEALNAMARVQRKLGRYQDAARSYQQIRADYGEVRLPGGIVLGAAAGLELGTMLLEGGDTTAATGVLLEHYIDLLEGRWALTAAQFDFVAAGVRESLERLTATGGHRSLRDTLGVLRRTEVVRRENGIALLAFAEAAERFFRTGPGGGGPASVVAAGRSFHLVLLEPPAGAAGAARWGFGFDLQALARGTLIQVLRDSTSPAASWVLRSSSGDTLAASPRAPVAAAPRVATVLAGYSPWVLELAPAATGGAFLTSRRAVYLYAFVLLASILLFGLVLTIRTVGRELELARLKSDFVSTVSHEFKSPLTAIRHLAEMLTAGRIVSAERQQRYYQVLQEQSDRLTLLVDNVLDLARMEAGQRRVTLEPVDLAALIEETVAEVQQRVSHLGFRFQLERNGPLPVIQLDVSAIRQALANLLDNAVKYSGTSREVKVRGAVAEGHAKVAVQDFGIGIEPHDLGKVFERFYRAGDPLTRTVKGTGLGLALVREIVEAHGGSVEVRSEPGRGSTFTLSLPLRTG